MTFVLSQKGFVNFRLLILDKQGVGGIRTQRTNENSVNRTDPRKWFSPSVYHRNMKQQQVLLPETFRQHPSSVIFCSRVGWNVQSTRECFCYPDWGGNRDDHNSTCWVGARLLLFGLGAVKPRPTGSPRICIRRRLRKSLMTLVQVPFSFGSFTPKPFQFVLFIFVCFDKQHFISEF